MSTGRQSAGKTPATGRSSRERILDSARTLFYGRGIHATGVEELAEVAGVSKRTLYKLFGSKDDLVATYLTLMSQQAQTNERYLECTDLTPRERLLALFDRPSVSAAVRGCPIHNAAVELTNPTHPGRAVILAHKQDFLHRLIDTAGEAGAEDPEALGRHLFVLFEGATALSTSIGDIASYDYARPVAHTLIEQSIPPDDPGNHHTTA